MKDLADCLACGVRPAERTRRQIASEFRALIDDGARLLPAGEAKHDPVVLLERRYLPRHAVALFDAVYYLTDFKLEDGLNFFVAFVVLRGYSRAMNDKSLFVMLAVSGLLTQFGLQALFHMGVTLRLLPPTGMTLPFVSYGGSSIIAVALGMGMVLALTRRRTGEGGML